MELKIVDSSFGRDHLATRMTLTAHTHVARDQQPARPTVLQVTMTNTPMMKDARAGVAVLNGNFEWTPVLELASGEWLRRVNPTTNPDDVQRNMQSLADELFRRAVTILEA